MFKTEQHISRTSKNPAGKGVFKTGITLANQRSMTRKITYKEITLALGILVAVLIAFTLWVNQPIEQTSIHSTLLPGAKQQIATQAKSVIKTAIDIFF